MAVTEIVQFVLKPGTDLGSKEGKDITDFTFKTVSEQEGCEAMWHGLQVEDSGKLDYLVDWSNISDHEKFATKEIYEPFKERAHSLVTGDPGSLTIIHVDFRTPIGEVAAAPVVEMLLMYVPLDAGDEVPQGVQKVLDAATAHKQGCIAGAHGWVVEELENEKFEGKLKGYYAAIGWKSIEVHQRYRETEAFKESIPSLRTVAKALNMHHTSFTKYGK